MTFHSHRDERVTISVPGEGPGPNSPSGRPGLFQPSFHAGSGGSAAFRSQPWPTTRCGPARGAGPRGASLAPTIGPSRSRRPHLSGARVNPRVDCSRVGAKYTPAVKAKGTLDGSHPPCWPCETWSRIDVTLCAAAPHLGGYSDGVYYCLVRRLVDPSEVANHECDRRDPDPHPSMSNHLE